MFKKAGIPFIQVEIIGVIFGVILGSLLHFAYALSGKNWFVGMFSAVNESPWEHLKLLVTPVVLFLAVEWFMVKDKRRLLFAKCVQILTGMIFIEAFYYTYTGALGFESLAVDIVSFVLVMVIGYGLSYHITQSKAKLRLPASVYILFISIIVVYMALVTFAPPRVPMFMDQNTGLYGAER
jgi:hypothetical protein